MRFDWHRLGGLAGWLRRRLAARQQRAAVAYPTSDRAHGSAHGSADGGADDSAHELAQRQAVALLRAIDAGGLPLHPGRVNQIARQLGLEVSTAAPVEQTVARIRAALARLA